MGCRYTTINSPRRSKSLSLAVLYTRRESVKWVSFARYAPVLGTDAAERLTALKQVMLWSGVCCVAIFQADVTATFDDSNRSFPQQSGAYQVMEDLTSLYEML